jgi:monofunctional biosynthetic peptidoglycan transglycosylase
LDFRSLRAALKVNWRSGKTVWGGSTITQQLAKNLYLSPSRNLPRKVKEAVTALRLELALPKARILELYLNVAEWGPGVWGAQAASRTYFGVPASQLDERAAAALAATLPHPRTSNPRFQPERTLVRRDLILARYRGVDVYVPPEVEEVDTTPIMAPLIEPELDSITDASPSTDNGGDTLTPDGMNGGDTLAKVDTLGTGSDSLP